MKAKTEFLSGIKAELPILIGVIPFGMIYGVMAIAAGIPIMQAQAMSAVVFAGSAQFVATQLISQGAPGSIVVLTIAMINLRHLLYSASVSPYLKGIRTAWKWLLAYLLTDEAYAVTIVHYKKEGSSKSELEDGSLGRVAKRHYYLLGAGMTLWTGWQLSTAAGIFLGAVIPETLALDFALSLTFIALVMPVIEDRATVASALAAGICAILTFQLPYRLGLVIATLVGIIVGVALDKPK